MGSFNKLKCGVVRLRDSIEIFPIIDSLLQSPLIKSAEPAGVLHTEFSPNDSFFNSGKQWGLYNYGQNPPDGTPGADIHVQQAWDITRGDSSILIAILDTGIPLDSVTHQLSHPDLSNSSRIKLGPDVLRSVLPDTLRDPDPSVRDVSGHGTHVAGILGAETNNSIGIAGVAGGCKLLIIQAFDKNGVGHPQAFRGCVKNQNQECVTEGIQKNPIYRNKKYSPSLWGSPLIC